MTVPLIHFDEDTTCIVKDATSILPCDAYHHYYHYQSSAQYVWLAAALYALGKNEEALAACNKAIFQDHFNQEAITGREGKILPHGYTKHPTSDIEFCASIGKPLSTFSNIHDQAAERYFLKDYAGALSLAQNNKEHSNSWFLVGKCRFALEEFEKAADAFSEAICLSHINHDAYHQAASLEHQKRGKKLYASGHIDLAIADFTKALDLYKANKNARQARAMAYKLKGNLKMAQEDEDAC